MNQRGIIPLKTGTTPALRVIDGGKGRPEKADPSSLAYARHLAEVHFAAMMRGDLADSQEALFIFSASYEEEKMDMPA